jgi:hypothetical protein
MMVMATVVTELVYRCALPLLESNKNASYFHECVISTVLFYAHALRSLSNIPQTNIALRVFILARDFSQLGKRFNRPTFPRHYFGLLPQPQRAQVFSPPP